MNAFGLLVVLGILPPAAQASTRFPIGLYYVTHSQDFPEIAAAGFTVVDIRSPDHQTQDILGRRANDTGLSVMADPRPYLANGSTPPGDFRVAAWHLFDEPEVNKPSTASLAQLYERTRSWDRAAPAVIVVGDGGSAKGFAPWADVMMLDWYPVPHLSLETLGSEIAIARAGISGRPLWAVLQAMDWKDYPQRDPTKPRIGRFPEDWELRYMTLSALVHGARGVFYYAYTTPQGQTLRDFPERWQIVKDAVRELRSFRPYLEAGPGVPLGGRGRRVGRRWRVGKKTLTIMLDPLAPRAPTITESR